MVWIQWCVGHLTDEDFVMTRRCAEGPAGDGIHEGEQRQGWVRPDTDDSSLTRSHKYFMHLFEDQLGWRWRSTGCRGISQRSSSGSLYALRPSDSTHGAIKTQRLTVF